ncbi:MAG: phenylacetate--CoA ligase family protein [Eubacteriaceae bacterium]|nr:phenylacetate--CoA ligase family protein [Eubacteriaceae bacterium]
MISKTPLEVWIAGKINKNTDERLTREHIERYQVDKLNEMIAYVKYNSRFYKNHLAEFKAGEIKTVDDIKYLPFTDFRDFNKNPNAFACVSQQQISRIMTVQTSGTTDAPKRVFYTEEDQESTIDFFQFGMSNLAAKGDNVLILLPGNTPGSVGDLLHTALSRLGARGVKYGLVMDPIHTLKTMEEENINVLVGIPVQLLSLARASKRTKRKLKLKSILLSTDYVPGSIVDILENTWDCRVFNHYGMTETGLGGAVQCEALSGCHMREADLLFEIVDPVTGSTVKDGEYGEVVFTSLTAKGTPFIRYRTGDISRFLKESCPCGTVLKSMDTIKGRIKNRIFLRDDIVINMYELDEALFKLEGIVNFKASISSKPDIQQLNLEVQYDQPLENDELLKVYAKAMTIPSICQAVHKGFLKINVEKQLQGFEISSLKRIIKVE